MCDDEHTEDLARFEKEVIAALENASGDTFDDLFKASRFIFESGYIDGFFDTVDRLDLDFDSDFVTSYFEYLFEAYLSETSLLDDDKVKLILGQFENAGAIEKSFYDAASSLSWEIAKKKYCDNESGYIEDGTRHKAVSVFSYLIEKAGDHKNEDMNCAEICLDNYIGGRHRVGDDFRYGDDQEWSGYTDTFDPIFLEFLLSFDIDLIAPKGSSKHSFMDFAVLSIDLEHGRLVQTFWERIEPLLAPLNKERGKLSDQ